jgi:hypothetical protein
MQTANYSNLQKLQKEFVDLFTSFYGMYPKHTTEQNWNNTHWLKAQIQNILDQIDGMKNTSSGLNELRNQGWIINENDIDLQKWHSWLKTERDRYFSNKEQNVA